MNCASSITYSAARQNIVFTSQSAAATGTLARHEQQRRGDGDEAEEIEVERVEQRERPVRHDGALHHSPFGSAGSHISHTGCVCAISRSRSYTNPSRLYSEFS